MNENIIKHLNSISPNYIEIAQKAEGKQSNWLDIIQIISKQQCCFVSEWFFTEEAIKGILPKDYNGNILKRGADPDIPVPVEWPSHLMNQDAQSQWFIKSIWNYGIWGYCLPHENYSQFARYTAMDKASRQDIVEFFDIISHIFVLMGELDEMWVISRTLDSNELMNQLTQHKVDYF